jgi:hypothetical protein
MTSSRNRQALWIALGLAGLMSATLVFGFRQHGSSFDDAYITYRYARNIALGRGFVYNVGESVLGTTTPLYTLLLAGLSLIWPDLPLLSHTVGVLAWMLCVPLTYGIGQVGRPRTVGIAAAAFIAVNPLFLNVLGMETTLYILLILSTFYLHLREQPSWAALCAGLAFLMRWDGILVVGVFLFAELLKERKTFFRASLVCMSIIVPWLAYSFVTFGSVFPNSFFAKVGQGWNQGLGGAEIGSFGRGLWLLADSMYSENHLFILLPIFAVLGLLSVLLNRARWWPLLLWTMTYLGGYIALGVLRFGWYYTPLAPALALLVAEGIELATRPPSLRFGSRARLVTFTTLLLVLCLLPNIDLLLRSRRTEMDVHSATYVQVGEWLKTHTPPSSSVALLEIGIIGFFSDRTVIDTMGLVSPEMVGHLENWRQTLEFAINYYWPDYVVALERTAWADIVNEPWFKEAYSLQTQIENDADPVAPASIYRLREGFPLGEFALDSKRVGSFLGGFALRKFQVVEDRTTQGGSLHVQLTWRAQSDINADYRWHFDLVNASDGQEWMLATELQPMRGGNPTHQWLEGDTVVDAHTLAVPDYVPAGYYLLKLVVIGQDGAVARSTSGDTTVGDVVVGPIRIGNDLVNRREPAYPVAVSFADNVHLMGYDLETAPDSTLSPTFYWQASSDVARDYTVFVHLLSPEGDLVAQHDSPPRLPTSLWVPGIQVRDFRTLILPTPLPSAVYQMRVGLYHWPDMERVPVTASGCLDAANDAVRVGQISFGNGQALDRPTCPDTHLIEMSED